MQTVVEAPAVTPVDDRATPRTSADSPFGAGLPVISASSPLFGALAASVVKPG